MQSRYTIGQEDVRLSAVRPVRIQQLAVDEPVPPHDHAFTELCLVRGGGALHCTADGESQLKHGTVIVVPPGPAHGFRAPQELVVTNIYYLAEWFLWDLNLLWQNEGLVPLFFSAHLFRKAEMLQAHIFQLSPDEMLACARELEDIEREYDRDAPSLFLIRGAFSKLLVTLARAYSREVSYLNEFDFRPEVWSALESMDTAIKDGRGFAIEEFAHTIGFSADGFSRVFRGATGLPPSEYFQWRRAQHAGHLLLRSKLSISEISARLGFADAAHLTRSFGKWQGRSPREFRRLYSEVGDTRKR